MTVRPRAQLVPATDDEVAAVGVVLDDEDLQPRKLRTIEIAHIYGFQAGRGTVG